MTVDHKTKNGITYQSIECINKTQTIKIEQNRTNQNRRKKEKKKQRKPKETRIEQNNEPQIQGIANKKTKL